MRAAERGRERREADRSPPRRRGRERARNQPLPLSSRVSSPSLHLFTISQKRLAELRAAADAPSTSTTGTLPTVIRAQYVERVTRASLDRPVLALLVREGGSATGGACCDAVAALATLGASPTGAAVSCVKVEADEAASGPGRLPDAALPTLLVYVGGSAVAKLTGGASLGAAGGGRITPASLLKAVRAAAPGVLGGGGEGGRGGSSSDDE